MSPHNHGLLSNFIEQHHREIIGQFSASARRLMPGRADMSETDFRDHAREMLTAIVQDLNTEQSVEEQSAKSQGVGTAHMMAASGRLHAEGRPYIMDSAQARCLRSSVHFARPFYGCTN
jgi:hypothetical protein